MHSSSFASCFRGNIAALHAIAFFGALYFYHPIATLYYQGRGLDFVQINSLWAVVVIIMAVSEVPSGILADRIGRKWAIVLALALQLSGEIVFVYADVYPLFVASAVLGGVGFAFSSGCLESIMYDTLRQRNQEGSMQRVMGQNGASAQLAMIAGAVVGGHIARDLTMNSYIYLIVMTIGSVAIALLVSLLLREPEDDIAREEEGAFAILSSGLFLLYSNRKLRRIVALSVLANPLTAYLITFYQPHLLAAGVGADWLGLSLALGSLLGAASSHFAHVLERILGIRWALFTATLLPGLLYIALAFSSSSWPAVLTFVATFGAATLQRPIFSDYINRHIDSSRRTTVLSIISMLSGAYVAAMGMVTGALAEISLPLTFATIGVITIGASFLLRIDARHVSLKE
jgi:MFS family permease